MSEAYVKALEAIERLSVEKTELAAKLATLRYLRNKTEQVLENAGHPDNAQTQASRVEALRVRAVEAERKVALLLPALRDAVSEARELAINAGRFAEYGPWVDKKYATLDEVEHTPEEPA